MGNCYKANTHLFLEMAERGHDVKLCHGVVIAASYFKHMKPGTRFMHCWVEAQSKEHGSTVHDASDNIEGVPEYTWHTKEAFDSQMRPRFVIKMNLALVRWHIENEENYGDWNLHPEHRMVNR